MIKLTDLLENTGLYGKIAFGDKQDPPKLAKLQGATPGSEPDTKREATLLQALIDWIESSGQSSDQLYRYKSEMPILAKTYPQIFKPTTPNGTILYRGLSAPSSNLKQQVQNARVEDWVPVKQGWFLYKKPVITKPFLEVQSWTYDLNVAKRFGAESMILVTKQDDSFFMNNAVLKALLGTDEKEILHFGKKYTNEVYVLVADYQFSMLDINIDLSDSEYRRKWKRGKAQLQSPAELVK